MASERMKKIALITWFGYRNYGTVLQVAALYEMLSKLVDNVDIVDYEPNGKYIRRFKWKGLLDELGWIARRASSKLFKAEYAPKAREMLFEDFLREHLTLTSPCPTMAELESLNDRYDTFVCGSDQIWAPSVFDRHYFLDWVGDDRLKVAYGPSVGLLSVDDSDVAYQMARLCERFDALSTRETSGSKIVSGLTGREVATVLDPTLLIPRERWMELSFGSKIALESGAYLLAYMLSRDESKWGRIYAMGKSLGLAVRVIPMFRRDFRRSGCIKDPIGPYEFVSLITHASYVCTDSFHGVAFSINLERDFCAFERFKKGDAINQNSRIHNILDKVDLHDRLVTDGILGGQLTEPINWAVPHERLLAERERSLSWLKAALRLEPGTQGLKDNIEHNHTLCCGCTVCEAVCPVDAIEVRLDTQGFWRARVDQDACISCRKCRRVCPFIEHSSSLPLSEGTLFSYKCSDTQLLLTSSSGGAGMAIARECSDAGAAVLGCIFDVSKSGAVDRLVAPGDSEGLVALAGSKYMQSQVGSALAEAAAHEGPLCIIGTPCQVSAACNLLGGREGVTFVDLVCHGVPTRNLYIRYKEWLEKSYDIDPSRARTVFRYKPRGWREIYIRTTDGEREACLHQRRDPYFLI